MLPLRPLLLVGLAACSSPSEALPGDTDEDVLFPTADRIVETRPDLSPCSERTGPVMEDVPSRQSSWEHEGIPLCPGDQLVVHLGTPGWAESAEVRLLEGSIDDVTVVLAWRDFDEPVDPQGDVWAMYRDDIDPCDTWRLPIQISAAPDAAPAQFDVRFIDSGERCPASE